MLVHWIQKLHLINFTTPCPPRLIKQHSCVRVIEIQSVVYSHFSSVSSKVYCQTCLNLLIPGFSLDWDEWIMWTVHLPTMLLQHCLYRPGCLCVGQRLCCLCCRCGQYEGWYWPWQDSWCQDSPTHANTHTHRDSQPVTSCCWTMITAFLLCCSHLNLNNSTNSPPLTKDVNLLSI